MRACCHSRLELNSRYSLLSPFIICFSPRALLPFLHRLLPCFLLSVSICYIQCLFTINFWVNRKQQNKIIIRNTLRTQTTHEPCIGVIYTRVIVSKRQLTRILRACGLYHRQYANFEVQCMLCFRVKDWSAGSLYIHLSRAHEFIKTCKRIVSCAHAIAFRALNVAKRSLEIQWVRKVFRPL